MLQIQNMAIHEKFHKDPPFPSHLAKLRLGNFDDSPVLMKNISSIIGVINLKIMVDHT